MTCLQKTKAINLKNKNNNLNKTLYKFLTNNFKTQIIKNQCKRLR